MAHGNCNRDHNFRIPKDPMKRNNMNSESKGKNQETTHGKFSTSLINRVNRTENLILTISKCKNGSVGDVFLQRIIAENYHIAKLIKRTKNYLKSESCNNLSRSGQGIQRIYIIATEYIISKFGVLSIQTLVEYVTKAQNNSTALSLVDIRDIPSMLEVAIVEQLGQIINAQCSSNSPKMPFDKCQFLQRENENISDKLKSNSSDFEIVINLIGTIKFIGTVDWTRVDLVGKLCVIDNVLKNEFCGIFVQSNQSTKNRYRFVIQGIAKKNLAMTEEEVARVVVSLANSKDTLDKRKSHVGYYLVDSGLSTLTALTHSDISVVQKGKNLFRQFPGITFIIGCITIVAILFCFGMCKYLDISGNAFIIATTFLVSTRFASEFVNFVATKFVIPECLPSLDFSVSGIPSNFRTLVVIPSIIFNERSIKNLIHGLEVRFVANQDKFIDFALLTDFEDSTRKINPGDEHLLLKLKYCINGLNEKYGTNKFFAFHRPRKFNLVDKIWMGYERKRGKLMNLNDLLRGEGVSEFNTIVGDHTQLIDVKYVITLDTDTLLPKDAACKMIETMAHPLNHPVLDESTGVVVQGFGILQPRVCLNLPPTHSSIHGNMCVGKYCGLDPYNWAVSNVHQDLFGEVSFVGKGIYDVDMFRTLNRKFHENRILSHDLIEGCYLRTGFVSTVQLFEDYPQTYLADVKRRHRWIRGDWQILEYLGSTVMDGGNKRIQNHLSTLSKWKILDNQRRSLIPVFQLLLVLLCWNVSSAFWALTGISVLLQSTYDFSLNFMGSERTVWRLSPRYEAKIIKHIVSRNVGIVLFYISCLPFEAHNSVDAIVRTIWRLAVSKRNLLDWTASECSNGQYNLYTHFKTMWFGPFLSIFLVYSNYLSAPPDACALSNLVLWLFSPFIAWYVSQLRTILPNVYKLNLNDQDFLFRLVRKTWGFFDHFSNSDTNYIPPDIYREGPTEMIANRTSPTNIGLALLSNLSAYDFGYISGHAMIIRTQRIFQTLEKLEMSRGHFYNWYDTQTLLPLYPRYISTVDSGNFSGCLIVLVEWLRTFSKNSVIPERLFEGLLDTFQLTKNLLREINSEGWDSIESVLKSAIENKKISSVRDTFQYLYNIETIFDQSFAETVNTNVETNLKFQLNWVSNFSLQLKDMAQDLFKLIPDRLDNMNALQLSYTDLINNDEYDQNITVEIIRIAKKLTKYIERLLQGLEFDFLFCNERHLLAIGFNVETSTRDESCYDLLASEARLGIFVAISLGRIPLDTWFCMGRGSTENSKSTQPILLSWSGSMFEYLMPELLMPTYPNTLIARTQREVVKVHRAHGRFCGTRWGVSESACAVFVPSANDWSYRALGVPELGLKEQTEDIVIAPYASMLALMVDTKEACKNLIQLSELGFEGNFGMYEAGDFTPCRLMPGESCVVIQSFFSHHQGMSLLSMANVLLREPMRKRFAANVGVQSIVQLLKES